MIGVNEKTIGFSNLSKETKEKIEGLLTKIISTLS